MNLDESIVDQRMLLISIYFCGKEGIIVVELEIEIFISIPSILLSNFHHCIAPVHIQQPCHQGEKKSLDNHKKKYNEYLIHHGCWLHLGYWA
jgi:hypothetical protein